MLRSSRLWASILLIMGDGNGIGLVGQQVGQQVLPTGGQFLQVRGDRGAV